MSQHQRHQRIPRQRLATHALPESPRPVPLAVLDVARGAQPEAGEEVQRERDGDEGEFERGRGVVDFAREEEDGVGGVDAARQEGGYAG